MKRKALFSAFLVLVLSLSVTIAMAQTDTYEQRNLVSDMAGVAAHTDPKLINPWEFPSSLVSRFGFPTTTAAFQPYTMPPARRSLPRC